VAAGVPCPAAMVYLEETEGFPVAWRQPRSKRATAGNAEPGLSSWEGWRASGGLAGGKRNHTHIGGRSAGEPPGPEQWRRCEKCPRDAVHREPAREGQLGTEQDSLRSPEPLRPPWSARPGMGCQGLRPGSAGARGREAGSRRTRHSNVLPEGTRLPWLQWIGAPSAQCLVHIFAGRTGGFPPGAGTFTLPAASRQLGSVEPV